MDCVPNYALTCLQISANSKCSMVRQYVKELFIHRRTIQCDVNSMIVNEIRLGRCSSTIQVHT